MRGRHTYNVADSSGLSHGHMSGWPSGIRDSDD